MTAAAAAAAVGLLAALAAARGGGSGAWCAAAGGGRVVGGRAGVALPGSGAAAGAGPDGGEHALQKQMYRFTDLKKGLAATLLG